MPKRDSGDNEVRRTFLAGQWYPAGPAPCREAIATYAEGVVPTRGYCGLIGPHAGWAYSGQTAARGYATLATDSDAIELVVVFGSHRGAFGPNTIFRGEAWDTPLGRISNAKDIVAQIAEPLSLDDEPLSPRQPDNAVELHLPFVRYFFPRAELLMLGVAAAPVAMEIGEHTGARVRQSGRRAVFIGSTDLTHYGPNYDFAPHGTGEEAVTWVRHENDRGFVEAILQQNAAGVLDHADMHHSACCPGAVAATLAALRAYGHELKPKLVEHTLSCDVHPSPSFVGYASVVL